MDRIVNKLKCIKTEMKWKLDALKYKKELKQQDIQSIINSNNIWILMPHSDDEWIGCSQLLRTKPSAIHVIDMNMNGDDDEILHSIRKKELLEMSEKFGYRVTLVDDIDCLGTLLINENPEIVFLPSFLDWHSEHHVAIEKFVETAKNTAFSGKVGMYQISIPLPIEYINAGKLMTKADSISKWNLFSKVYKTQNFLPKKRFKLNEMINGAISGSYALEAYSILSFEEWMRFKENCSLDNSEIQKLKTNINDIKAIREIIENKVKNLGAELL